MCWLSVKQTLEVHSPCYPNFCWSTIKVSSLYQQIVLLACVALAVADVSHLDTVVRFDSVVNPDSYQYAYETSKGIKAEEAGNLKNAGSEQEAIVSWNIT